VKFIRHLAATAATAALFIAISLVAANVSAQESQSPQSQNAQSTQSTQSNQGAQSGQGATQQPVTCVSKEGERQVCPADTSAGVVLVKSTGSAPCLLGKTWGYDDKSIWVSDGCAGDFIAGQVAQPPKGTGAPGYVPNQGFKLYDGEKGQIYFRLFTYARYLNQRNTDATYTDSFGNTKNVQQRQDIQLNKFFSPFSGWFLTPKFRYYLYVWSQNPAQGQPAQVVGGGNISYTFNRFVSVGAGITSLPSTRSTEGQFPYWLGVDTRLMADEFFRGSYTQGVWLKGELQTKVKYMAMIANNLSTLGVSSAQLNNKLDTQSYSVQWLPTTGEFGLWGTFGDYDWHEKAATRVGVHYTRSLEDKQSQPNTDGIENTQIRLTDGSIVFTPDLFGPGISVEEVTYHMTSIDGGVKYHGLSVEGEYYRRWLTNFTGVNTTGLATITDNGYQMQTSAMAVPKILQGYVSWSQIFGHYGNPSDVRFGASFYPVKTRGLRLNGELIKANHSPVGYGAYPLQVGMNGKVFHINLEMNF
jgi:hypothetical protein